MRSIKKIKLEILRPGPSHNQLLSPLTPYLALCRHDGPVTINLPFEQRQLLTRLERLRYYSGKDRIPDNQREAELREMGESLGKVLGQIPALLSELGGVRSAKDTLVHLRLAFSAHELALVPFECAIAPDGFPGSGSPLFLQANTPITLTREIRRGQDLKVHWDRKPRVLFIYATPGGLAPVPFAHHLMALRQAMAPWIAAKDTETQQINEVAKMLTVLPEATLPLIWKTCANEEYTHVHILAHGASYEHAGDIRYGLALCKEGDPAQPDVVDGERLALALTTGRATSCGAQGRPNVVTLATCDSANTKSVLTPGGSIAHELHAAGIPWVFASQFPLWMRSSNLFTAILYKRLLQGADPRCVLHELRQRLRTSCPETHDWASIVAYATVPSEFGAQVAKFQDRQNRARLEAQLDRMDHLLNSGMQNNTLAETAIPAEIIDLCKAIGRTLEEWRNSHTAEEEKLELAERLAVSGAAEKRIGIAYARLARETTDDKNKAKLKKKCLAAYKRSCEYYHQAMVAIPGNHWYITQYLSMMAVLEWQKEDEKDEPETGCPHPLSHWWLVAQELCERHLTHESCEKRAWAYGSLAELDLLGTIYGNDEYKKSEVVKKRIQNHCRHLFRLCDSDPFRTEATKRQFRRYLQEEFWGTAPDPDWEGLVKTALHALGDREEQAAGDSPPPDAQGPGASGSETDPAGA